MNVCLHQSFKSKRVITDRILLMLPADEEEDKMGFELAKDMQTGLSAIDDRRKEMLTCTQILIEGINQKIGVATLSSLHEHLMVIVFDAFQKEERMFNALSKRKNLTATASSMGHQNANSSELCADILDVALVKDFHIRQHLLIRQRLTIIGDILKQKDAASHIIAKRYLSVMFFLIFRKKIY